MTLAREGLPANTTRGYELLDSLTGFGTTSQMFDAAYWRAKEGELARTIVASPHISMARVHISTNGNNPFQRGVTPKASVAVTPASAAITAAQAKAVRYLVASAVSGLAVEDVAVIDANGNLLGVADEVVPAAGADDKAQALRERVARLLEARVGFGNAVVEVSVDTVTESEAIRERIFDPEGRVAVSTDTEERTLQSTEPATGEVTVASNLPDGQATGGDGGSSQNQELRERVNFEVSETEREIIRAPGAIKRVTVAVLVNNVTATSPEGEVTNTPRSEEELANLKELVASAVGFDEARGDVITIKSMQLQTAPNIGTEAGTSLLDGFAIDVMSAIQMAVLAIVTLVLGLFVVRPLLSKAPGSAPDAAASLPAPAIANSGYDTAPEPSSDIPALDGEISTAGDSIGDLPMMPAFGAPAGGGAVSADPVDRLRAMIGDRQEETVEILRTWLEEKEEKA